MQNQNKSENQNENFSDSTCAKLKSTANMQSGSFKAKFSLQKRKLFLQKQKQKNGEQKVLAILELSKMNQGYLLEQHIQTGKYKLDSKILLLEPTLKSLQLHQSVRHMMHLQETDSLFLFMKGKTITPNETTLQILREKYADKEDGILYIEFSNIASLG